MRELGIGKRMLSGHVERRNDVPGEVIRQFREHNRSAQHWKEEDPGLERVCGNE